MRKMVQLFLITPTQSFIRKMALVCIMTACVSIFVLMESEWTCVNKNGETDVEIKRIMTINVLK